MSRSGQRPIFWWYRFAHSVGPIVDDLIIRSLFRSSPSQICFAKVQTWERFVTPNASYWPYGEYVEVETEDITETMYMKTQWSLPSAPCQPAPCISLPLPIVYMLLGSFFPFHLTLGASKFKHSGYDQFPRRNGQDDHGNHKNYHDPNCS